MEVDANSHRRKASDPFSDLFFEFTKFRKKITRIFLHKTLPNSINSSSKQTNICPRKVNKNASILEPINFIFWPIENIKIKPTRNFPEKEKNIKMNLFGINGI